MQSIKQRLLISITACAAVLVISGCEMTKGPEGSDSAASKIFTTYNSSKPTIEHLALGMPLKFEACKTEVQGDNTNIEEVPGKVCQFLADGGEIGQYKLENHVILLSEGVNEGFSRQINIGVDTANNEVIRFSVITPGLQAQEPIFNALLAKFGEPVEAQMISEDSPNNPYALNSIVSVWQTEEGRIVFVGGVKGEEDAGLINAESFFFLNLQQQLQEAQAQQQQAQ